MIVELSETATYAFSEPAENLALELRLKPLALPRQSVLWSAITIRPEPAASDDTFDRHGNIATQVHFDRPVSRLVVSGFGRVRCSAAAPCIAAHAPADLLPEEENGNVSHQLADTAFACDDLNRLVRDLQIGWHHDQRVTSLDRPISDIDATRRGVCQDIARLAVDRLRRRHVPARFVVGYAISQRSAPMARHAWIAAHIGGEWMEIDIADLGDEKRLLLATAWGSDLAGIGPVIGRSRIAARTTLRVVAQASISADLPETVVNC